MPYGQPTHGWWCNARTYPTRCKYCGERVFFFTCDCGSKVFFDELGWPWPEHHCLQYLITQYGKEFIERAMAAQIMLPGRSATDHRIAPDYARAVGEHQTRPAPPCIVRCNPEAGQVVCDIGTIRELIPQVDVFRKMRVARSAFGIQLLGPLGRDAVGQVTIHTGDLAHEDAKSFTCFVSGELLASLGVSRGDVVSFQLRALSIPGRQAVWLCEWLEFPFA